MLTSKAGTQGLLLDTHVWLWMLFQDPHITRSRALLRIEAAERQGLLYLSAISLCEVGMLAAKKRIQIPYDCLTWVQEALKMPGLNLVPLTPEIAIGASVLPGDVHGDPADRLLIATARQLTATLVTGDERILSYGKQGHISTLSI